MFESLLLYAFENPPVPENIPKPPREGIGISCRWGGSVRPQNVKKCLKLKVAPYSFLSARASFQTPCQSRARDHALKCRQTWRPNF